MTIKMILNSKETEACRDVAGTYHMSTKVPYGTHHGKFDCKAQVADNGDGVTTSIVIPEWLVLGTATVVMAHAKAINGLVKAIDGICEMIDSVVNGIRRDFTKMIEDHYNK